MRLFSSKTFISIPAAARTIAAESPFGPEPMIVAVVMVEKSFLLASESVKLSNPSTLSKLVLFVIGSPAQFRDRFRSLSNVNLSGSQNASRNAAAAAEKTE